MSSSHEGLDGDLTQLLEAARRTIAADYAALGVLDRERIALERFVAAGLDGHTRAGIGWLPRGLGVLGLLIADPVPLRIDDLSADPRSAGFPSGHPVMRSFLGVPLLIDGQAWGNLYLADKQDGVFDEVDEYAAIAFAERAARLVEQARSGTPEDPSE